MAGKLLDSIEKLRNSVDEKPINISRKIKYGTDVLDAETRTFDSTDFESKEIKNVQYRNNEVHVNRLIQDMENLALDDTNPLVHDFDKYYEIWKWNENERGKLIRDYEDFYRINVDFNRLFLNPPASTSFETDYSISNHPIIKEIEEKIKEKEQEISRLKTLYKNSNGSRISTYQDRLENLKRDVLALNEERNNQIKELIIFYRMEHFQPDLLPPDKIDEFNTYEELIRVYNKAIANALSTMEITVKDAIAEYKHTAAKRREAVPKLMPKKPKKKKRTTTEK